MPLVLSGDLVLLPAEAALDADSPLVGWHNVVAATTIVADVQDASFPASNLANPATHLEWRSTSTALQYVTITTNYVGQIDYVGIAKHNFGSAGIAVSLGYFTAGPTWNELVAPFIPADDKPIMLRFTPQGQAEVKIKLAAGSAAPRAAVVYCGKLLVVPRIYSGHTPLPYGRRNTGTSGMSESGNFLGSIITGEWRETVLPFRLIDPAFYRGKMDAFVASANARTPFFFAWRPSSYPLEVGYGWLTDNAEPVPEAPSNLFTLSMSVRGIA